MSDKDREAPEDKLDATGEEPAAESGAGYGDHAPAPSARSDEAKERADDPE